MRIITRIIILTGDFVLKRTLLAFNFVFSFFSILLLSFTVHAEETSSKRVLVLGNSHTSEAMILNFNKKSQDVNIRFKLQMIETLKPEDATEFFAQFDMVILDARNKRRLDRYKKYQAAIKANPKVTFLPMMAKKKTPYHQNISLENTKIIANYYNNGGAQNFQAMPLFLANDIFKTASIDEIPEPIIFPNMAIYHPDAEQKVFGTLDEYLSFKKLTSIEQKVVGIAIYKGNISTISTAHVDQLIRKLEKQNILPITYYFSDRIKKRKFKEFLTHDDKMIADVIINFRSIHSGEKRKKDFEELGINVLSAIKYYGGDQADWEKDNQGLSTTAVPFALYTPEYAGVIDPMIAFYPDKETKTFKPIDYQIDSILNKALNIIDLKYKANKDKKVAFFFYNSPAGATNFGASFLNVSQSLADILKELKKQGYQTTEVEEEELIEQIQAGLNLFYQQGNRQQRLDKAVEQKAAIAIESTKYQQYFESLQPELQKKVIKFWGNTEQSSMYSKSQNSLVMPMLQFGNIMILPQPKRGESEDVQEKTLTHDKEVPLNHPYLATYEYIRNSFGADAIVHFGTHGTQEYLPGKERGLSIYDQPNVVVQDIPVIYPFIVDDVGEAMATKRRGRATVISHQTPPFSPAGLHGDDEKLHGLIHDYEIVDSENVRENVKKQIIEFSVEKGYEKDLEMSAQEARENFKEFLTKLDVYLHDLAAMNQPLGMHTFGRYPKEEHMILTLIQMLGEDYVNLVEAPDHDHHHSHDHNHSHSGHSHDKAHVEFYASNYEDFPKTHAYQLIKEFVIDGKSLDSIKDEVLQKILAQAKTHYANFTSNFEMQSLLNALDGKYIPSGSGGDPIRSPDSIPTGTNLYGFNPAKVPSKAAYDSGVQLTEDLIANHYQKHGKYPNKVAFVLWSTETMRNFGVVESQIMAAIGAKPTWNKSGKITGYEIIPISELKRPRIDVVVTASGLYRDTFPAQMQYIAKAIDEVARLKQDNNRLYYNSKQIQDAFEAKGIKSKEAAKLSTIRVFGSASGSYGTGTADIAMASDQWKNDKVITDLYLSRMSYAYGAGPDQWGIQNQALFEKNLKNVDAVVLSRSSNLYGLLTSDDPFQYLGSLAAAIRNVSGKTPETYISNLRNPKNAKNETAALFLAKEMQSRYFHPQWIEAMKEEGHQGAMEMLDVVNNLWGWEVMTPENIRDDQWQEFVEVYVNDKLNLDMKKFFEEHSPETLAQMAERYLEAIRKGYFKTDDETIKKLIETYVEMAEKHNVITNNDKFKEYLKNKATGFGLQVPSIITQPLVEPPASQAQKQQVQGNKLEKVQAEEKDFDYEKLWLYLALLLIILAGLVYQLKRRES